MYAMEPLIHHSDRGSQYCSGAYTSLLVEHGIAISMTENGDPYENALAERVNGIIKNEFNLGQSNQGFIETSKRVQQANIKAYNEIRIHASCNYLTPEKAHLMTGTLKKRWKNKVYKTEANPDCITHIPLPMVIV